jgi:DNA-binding MarR family transcriptional regulator
VTSQPTVAGSLTFLLGKVGGTARTRFALKLAPYGLKPRHCAVLELAGTAARTQLELATMIGVTPSVVVDMLDELERLDAVERVPQPGDRRRRVVELTPAGRQLAARAAAAAHEVDEELLGELTPDLRAAFRAGLEQVGAAEGFSYSADGGTGYSG